MMSHGDGVSGLLCMSQGNGEMTARERRQPIYSMGCYFHIIRGGASGTLPDTLSRISKATI